MGNRKRVVMTENTDRMTDAEFQAWVHRVTSKDKRSKEKLNRDIENEAGFNN